MTDEESSKLTPAYTNPLKTFIDDKIAPIVMKVLQGQITAPDFVENNPQGTTIQTYDDTGRPMTLVQKTDGTIVFSTEEYNKYLAQKKFDQELSDNTLTKVLMDTPGKVAGETGNVKTMGGMAEGSSKAVNLAEVSPLLKTESNTAFFWPGKTNGVGGAEKAAEIAKSQGGTTLESMIAEKK